MVPDKGHPALNRDQAMESLYKRLRKNRISELLASRQFANSLIIRDEAYNLAFDAMCRRDRITDGLKRPRWRRATEADFFS